MSFQDFTDKVRRMSPLARAFTSAALGVPAFGLVVAANMMAPGLATVAGLAVSLGGSIVVSSYSDPLRGAFNVGGMRISKDLLLNIGAFFGSYLFVAPKLVGAALGMMLAANASIDAPQAADAAQALESPAPIVQTMTPS